MVIVVTPLPTLVDSTFKVVTGLGELVGPDALDVVIVAAAPLLKLVDSTFKVEIEVAVVTVTGVCLESEELMVFPSTT